MPDERNLNENLCTFIKDYVNDSTHAVIGVGYFSSFQLIAYKSGSRLIYEESSENIDSKILRHFRLVYFKLAYLRQLKSTLFRIFLAGEL